MASFNYNPETPTTFHFSANQFTTSSSFANLLAYSPVDADDKTRRSSSLLGRVSEITGSGQPKFKSAQPAPLPISPPYFASSELHDSPVLLNTSNIFPSPTTGAFPFQAFNWNNCSICNPEDKNNNQDFASAWSLQESSKLQDSVRSEYASLQSISSEIATKDGKSGNKEKSVSFRSDCKSYQQQTQSYRETGKSIDGYNWRKYGQKQVKASQNPRSYYKCTYPNCPTTKKVERSSDGQITEILYKGSHNHPKPQSTRRSSSYSSGSIVASNASQISNPHPAEARDQSFAIQGIGRKDSVATSENSSISFDNGNLDQSSQSQKSRLADGDEFGEEPDAKRWKSEGGNEGIPAPGGRTVREPRVVVRTISDIDVLDDGYRWRKYGQKVVKGNPNPRSYYKCTYPGCLVRKHVERAADDGREVITTYEGKHDHAVPLSRRSHSLSRPLPRNDNIMPPYSESQVPFSLEIIPRNLGFLGSENSLASCIPQIENVNNVVFARAEDQSKNDSVQLLESLLE